MKCGVRGGARFSLVKERGRGFEKPKVCPKCGYPVDPDPVARFCWFCGARLIA